MFLKAQDTKTSFPFHRVARERKGGGNLSRRANHTHVHETNEKLWIGPTVNDVSMSLSLFFSLCPTVQSEVQTVYHPNSFNILDKSQGDKNPTEPFFPHWLPVG